MSDLNPYDKYLDGRAVEEILAATPAAISALIEKMGPAKAAAALAPGKWSPAEIVCHLADCEVAFGFRLRQTLAEPGHTIQPFDQDKWAPPYAGIAAADALAAFGALRKWNLLLLAYALPAHAGVAATHPERGTMTFQTIVETMAGHDRNHLAQLEKIAG
jgi:hypothetical protein